MRFALPLALLAALTVGCQEAAQKVDDGTTSHDYKPEHGGEILHLADHGPMLEVVADETAGTIKIFCYGPHHETLKLEKAPVLKIPAGPKQVTATGKDDVWTFADDLLKTHQEGLAFKVDISGKIYDQEWHAKH